jgi:zinc protease
VDEGAGTRDAIELADAFSRLGARLDIDVGPDATTLSVTCPSRRLPEALDLLADIVIRPRLQRADFERIRDLRLGRLRQLSRSASATAERAYVAAVLDSHPYGHGALGTTRSLESLRLEMVKEFWSSTFASEGTTLIVGGAVDGNEVGALVGRSFGSWGGRGAAAEVPWVGSPHSDSRIVLVDRPDSPQSELRVGHRGPSRRTDDYHALVTLNALVGGQFTSRINRKLREEQGVTYGARTSFDFRRVGGIFTCETSVQADATGRAVADILHELEVVRLPGAAPEEELALARASLSRGYVRQFETVGQIVRAATQLAVHDLADDTFDRFVPAVEAVSMADMTRAAERHLYPDGATIVVVGDATRCRSSLETLGRIVVATAPEF